MQRRVRDYNLCHHDQQQQHHHQQTERCGLESAHDSTQRRVVCAGGVGEEEEEGRRDTRSWNKDQNRGTEDDLLGSTDSKNARPGTTHP